MRLKINLQALNSPFLTHNYFYPLSTAIYKLLQFGSPKFSEFLHDNGYHIEGKRYKLFSFALKFEKVRYERSHIKLISPKAYLYVSTPLVDEFIQNFVLGTFVDNHIDLYGNFRKTIFNIVETEALPQPEFNNEMKFKCLSPIVVSTKKDKENGKTIPHYFRHDDDMNEFNRIVNQNARNKFEAVYGKSAGDKSFVFKWDEKYIQNRITNRKNVTVKQTIKELTIEATEVVGNSIPFSVNGDAELIKVCYECGFGDMNSMGFGLADAI